MKYALIALAALYLYVENYSITITTQDPNVNDLLKLPKQIPLKYLVLNDQNNALQFLQVYLAPNNKNWLF